MRYPFAFFFLSATLYSCSTDEPPQEVAALDTLIAEQVATADSSWSSFTSDVNDESVPVPGIPFELIAQEAEDLNVIRTCLARYEAPSLYRTIAASGTARVKGIHGLEIAIDPADLETEAGEPVSGEIDIEIREALTQTHFLRSGLSTLSNGKLLVSGGAYYVNATADGTQLRLKPGRSMAMKLPRITDSSMTLFYGKVSPSGEVNWLESNKKFTYNNENQDRDISFVVDERRRVTGDTVLRPKTVSVSADQMKNTPEILFIDEDTLVLGACGEWWPTPRSERKAYDAITVQGLGWINCDRFLDDQNMVAVNFAFNASDSVRAARIYLVFKSINSVMSQDFRESMNNNSFPRVPAGYTATIIAIGYKNGSLASARREITAGNVSKVVLQMSPIKEQDIPNLFAMR